MLGLGKILTKKIRFKLIKNPLIRKLIIWKNRNIHASYEYSIINFSWLFDSDFYLKKYPDVANSGIDPLHHFITIGARELKKPNSWFDIHKYIVEHKHKMNGQNPFVHFLINNHNTDVLEFDPYREWINRYENENDYASNEILQEINSWPNKPKISIILPTYNTEIKYLKQAVNSVKSQYYDNWELCIADDASDKNSVIDYLKTIEKSEKIKIKYRSVNGHISEASNSSLQLATGEFIALMDHDDKLSPNALYEIAKVIINKPDVELIYSDEDKIDSENKRFDPYFKSEWNKDLLYSQNYISHLGVYKTELVRKIGGFRKGFEGSQDYDLLLRYINVINEKNIIHIPKILYHWRAIKGSTALNINAKNYAVEAGRKALEEHIYSTEIEGEALITLNTQYRVKRKLKYMPLVSIIIPFKDQVKYLSQCVETIFEKSLYENYEILLVDNNSESSDTQLFLDSLKNNKIKKLHYPHQFNFSAINNYAAKKANGEYLLFLNNDTKPINEDWLIEIVTQLNREDVGIVGAKLFYEDDTVQHAGIVLGMGGVGNHWQKGIKKDNPGNMCRASLIQEYSAVTGACLAIKKDLFFKVQGFEEKLRVAFNDIDLCLKIRNEGYKVLFTPYAQLYHYESKSRISDFSKERKKEFDEENQFIISKWGKHLFNDPFFSNNYLQMHQL